MKILLVEDEEELSDIVSRGLRKYGYAVDKAYDGEEAMDYYSVNEYDIVILDLNIPKLDGLEVLGKIRLNDNRTKILILSARSAVDDHKGKAIATEQLLNHVWDSDAALYPDSLKYHIHSIKKKLVEAGCPPDLIQNIRGVGYKVEETSG
ncbi:DNA-binding response regulator [Paenibacillus woosongensis]|uniref:Response regulator n=1 Tax=Paenibacillus woosongensis TaxID=307580 RepID=A0A7X2Z5G0_9BACL|nr:DNA-binding response regulator [Paenibacillus woosongensis]MUG47857.1 response regulator [Paenibacillus woosongensis]